MVDYEGIFFDEDEVKKIQSYEQNFLGNVHECIHCTFIYKPDNDHLYEELLNKEIDIYLVSYGSNKNNSGFEVEIPEKYMKYYHNYDSNNNYVKPHITASISNNGKSKDTCKLKFTPLKEKVKITGRFGYWIKEENKEYVTFNTYNKQS